MGRADYLLLGDYNVQCYRCGCKLKASMAARNWQGFYVCPEHNEPRQPQDFVRAIPDNQTPPWTQPWPISPYVYTNQFLGFTDGVTKTFQLGDGLYDTTVTSVQLDGVTATGYTTNATGLITFTLAPTPSGQKVTASGTENAPA